MATEVHSLEAERGLSIPRQSIHSAVHDRQTSPFGGNDVAGDLRPVWRRADTAGQRVRKTRVAF